MLTSLSHPQPRGRALNKSLHNRFNFKNTPMPKRSVATREHIKTIRRKSSRRTTELLRTSQRPSLTASASTCGAQVPEWACGGSLGSSIDNWEERKGRAPSLRVSSLLSGNEVNSLKTRWGLWGLWRWRVGLRQRGGDDILLDRGESNSTYSSGRTCALQTMATRTRPVQL